MKKIAFSSLVLFLIAFMLPTTALILAADQAPHADAPIMLASCGQSPGPVRLRVFLKQLGIDFTENLLATAQDLVAAKNGGKPYKTLIIVAGASLKGMGAAGVSLKDELERTRKLIEEARKQKLAIIGAHIEGMARRAQGADAGDTSDEQSIDAVCPESTILLVRKDGDSDGRFSAIAKSKNLPLVMFEKNLDIGTMLKDLFKK
jgi:hypothetical protein